MKEDKEFQGEDATPRQIAEAITDRPTELKKIRIKYTTWWKKVLAFLCILPRTRMLTIKAPCAATMYDIVAIYDELKITKDVVEDIDGLLYGIVKENLPSIIESIAIAVHNKEGKPPKWLLDALWYQFEQYELATACKIVYRGLDFDSFFGIMTFVRNIKMLDIIGTQARGQGQGT
ncbi:hypothetical protein FKG96_12415 [Olivibacter sp. LS-1]|uniref:hypothetical protein n=1 Tax=Olivibacter sp. LS-1 TaxID=2592345 RepID=UPI0011EB2605|nr:hypothetical protein [Olivibacter sp. LS-1]QEL01576.1 hypothetical protein FKG96_12415 [Olivibacter sp. LS-1]